MVACVKAEDGVNGYIVEVEVGRVLVAVQVLGVVSEVEMVLGHRVMIGSKPGVCKKIRLQAVRKDIEPQ